MKKKKKVPAKDRLIVALDVPTVAEALRFVIMLRKTVRTFKVGHELFTKAGPSVVEEINALGGRVFLDLKFFDIPNTMAGGIKSASACKPFITNLHALAGEEAMRECVKAAKKIKGRPKLLAVTILTSYNTAALKKVGISIPIEKEVVRLCGLALACGMDGVVASPKEAAKLRAKFGDNFLIVTPGIRPAWSNKNDQKRVTSPYMAIRNGADYIVVGRPILTSSDPLKAAKKVIAEIELADI